MIDLDELDLVADQKSYNPELAVHFGAWLASGKLKSYKALEFFYYFRVYQDIAYHEQALYHPLIVWMTEHWHWREYSQMLANLNCIAGWLTYKQQKTILEILKEKHVPTPLTS